jgi:hypothetical protein
LQLIASSDQAVPFCFPSDRRRLDKSEEGAINYYFHHDFSVYYFILKEISHPSSSPARRHNQKYRTLRSQEIQNALFKRRSSLEASQSRKGMNPLTRLTLFNSSSVVIRVISVYLVCWVLF